MIRNDFVLSIIALLFSILISPAIAQTNCSPASTVYSNPLPWGATPSAGWTNYSAATPVTVTGSGNYVKVWFAGEATHQVGIAHASIGHQLADYTISDPTPFDLKFGGNLAVTVDPGATSTVESDWTPFTLANGSSPIIKVDYGAPGYNQFTTSGGPTAYKTSWDAGNSSSSGFVWNSSTVNHFSVVRVDAMTCDQPVTPSTSAPSVRVSLPLLDEPGAPAFAAITPPANDTTPNDYWTVRQTIIRVRMRTTVTAGNSSFLMLGDSICDRLDERQIHPHVANACIGYNTPAAILNEIADLNAAGVLSNIRAILLVGGAINAIGRGTPIATINAQFDAIFAARRVPLVWVPVLPTSITSSYNWNPGTAQVNAHVASLVAACGAPCSTVDLSSTFAPGGTLDLSLYATEEGAPYTHPSPAGELAIARGLRNEIAARGL